MVAIAGQPPRCVEEMQKYATAVRPAVSGLEPKPISDVLGQIGGKERRGHLRLDPLEERSEVRV
jgi:hypothetical protein